MDDLAYLPANKLANLLLNGTTTSVELVELFISRILKYDTQINSVIIKTFDSARKQAAERDHQISKGIILGPLHGVPITVKENNDVEGLPSTLGNPQRAEHIATKTSPPVQKLLDAGAILLGKTNCPLDLNDVQTYNEIYGRTSNPYDLCRTPGGSSGGSAAALAAGFTSLEFGGDIGGSIRTPAHCCGVFGHKATLGAVPAIPLDYGPIRSADIVVKGPMARSAQDLDLAMRLVSHLAGPERRALTMSLPECPYTKLKDFRVAVWGDDECCPVDSDVQNTIQHVIDVLRKSGCTVVDVNARPKLVGGSKNAFNIYKKLLAAEENQQLMSNKEKERMFKEYESRWKSENDLSASVSLQEKLEKQYEWITQSKQSWQETDKMRQQMRIAWEDFFSEFDVLICPICASVAWSHDEETVTDQPFWKVGNRIIRGANGHSTLYHDQVFWSGLTNVCGNPSTVFPAGHAISTEGLSSSSGMGMPIGLQIMGKEWSDLTTIGFAKALEIEGGFCFQRPIEFVDNSKETSSL